jgi:mono/diheme cytochrome c family protein
MASDWRPLARVGRHAYLGLVLLGGCNFYYDKVPSPDDLMKLVPWFDHMVRSPAIHPYEKAPAPRDTPRGSVPITGSEPEWGTGDPSKLAYGFDTLAAARTSNPLGRGVALEKGDSVYHNFCAVCHGPVGDGKGPVGPRMGAPSLLTDKAKGYTDGYLYGIIRYGRGVMPQYGDKIFLSHDRWAAVNYLRRLQGFAADAAGPAPDSAATKGASR